MSHHQQRSPSRREFLKVSAAGLSVAACALPVARSAHAAGSDTLKIGLIGCGGRGAGAAANAMNADANSKLVAVTDIFEDKLQKGLQSLKGMKPEQVAVDADHCFVGFDGYEKVIASDVDVVVIACASRFHPKYLKAAIDANKHVFVEKPHAIDPPGIHTVIAACEQAKQKGLSVVSGLCWRYDRGVQETMKRLHDGAIGDVVAIQETYMRTPYHTNETKKGDWSETEYQFRNWYHFSWLSGDDIAQSLIHSMDKGAWLMRDEPPVVAYGQGGRASLNERVYGNVFDHFSIMYEYANGVRMYAIGRAQSNCHNDVSDIFLGTKGRCNLLKNEIAGETNWKYAGPKPPSMYDEEHVALFQAIRSGTPVNNGTYMVRSSMLAILGQMVAYTGQQIAWDDAMKATYTLGPDECDFQTPPPVEPDENGTYPVPMPGFHKMG
ncbi:MAG: twin-arginine translocation signal domain-containing protein [Planctomycetes bacterium]|nr:twin-arginine translocation signal domain-containing protein [Planctomycetota bacterium]